MRLKKGKKKGEVLDEMRAFFDWKLLNGIKWMTEAECVHNDHNLSKSNLAKWAERVSVSLVTKQR